MSGAERRINRTSGGHTYHAALAVRAHFQLQYLTKTREFWGHPKPWEVSCLRQLFAPQILPAENPGQELCRV